jgi:hypothetical protein
MSAHASSPSATSPFHFTADEQSKQSFGGRLIRIIVAGQQRKADRRILMYLPNHDSYREEFGVELERRLLGR